MKSTWFTLLMLFNTVMLSAACKEPFSLKYTEISTRSIRISWVDNNNPIIGYQLAYGEKGVILADATRTDIVNQKFRKLEDLKSGTGYTFWLRSVCAAGDSSKWAGPFAFTTAISNVDACGLNLDIRDNNCDNGLTDIFNIEVSLPPSVNPYKLQSVSLIVSHPWPADLFIQLESPQGVRVVLSDRHGTVDDNFGIINEDCDRPSIFSDEACLPIAEGVPPFEGNFQPDEALSELNLTANPSGLWKLVICDGAVNDKGILKYVHLNFVEEPCNTVESFFVSRITHTSFEVTWDKPANCKNLEIHYQKKGDPMSARTAVVNCGLGKYSVQGLENDTEYEFYLVSSCLTPLFSVPSCIRTLHTSCTNVAIVEDFEDYEMCQQSCAEPCNLDGVFFNVDGDESDWIINKGETPTEFTGPSSGIFGGGKYIYLESNPTLCAPRISAILETKCLKSGSVSTECDLDFAHHMYGKDAGTLKIQISINNKITWNTIFESSGNQGNAWIQHVQNLGVAPQSLFALRFVGQTTQGNEGDLALDLITLGNVSVAEAATYYQDVDADGYGNTDVFIQRCDSNVPQGYSRVGGDCDDNNAAIHPGAVDIPCNQIDENCDGSLVLTDTANPMAIQNLQVIDETCNGKGDGSIGVSVSGGTPPIQFNWLHGAVGNSITALSSGFYKCKITDINGCGLETPFIEVRPVSNFQAVVESIDKPACSGVNNGTIHVNHNGIFTPFSYQWNRGDTTLNLNQVAEGTYYLTITNGIGCKKELGPIEVTPTSSLQPVITFLKSPLCHGDATGILELNVVNGVPPYSYLWQDGFTGNRRSMLTAGDYIVTITDAINCRKVFLANLPGPDVLELDVVNLEDVRCFGTKTGQIRLHVNGGTQPFNYAWSDNGPNAQVRPNLLAGNYAVTVFDDNGCSAERQNIIIRQPPELLYSIDEVIPAGCLLKKDGAIKTTLSGGLPPYKYFWTGTNQNTGDIDQLLPNSYTLTAVDASNCKITTESISVPSGNISYNIDLERLQDNICPADPIAVISATCSDATPPIDFNWSNGVQRVLLTTSDTLRQLLGGSYSLTITDADGCISQSDDVPVSTINPFNFSLDVDKNLCNSDQSGSITLLTSGATPPYLIKWDNGMAGNKIENLANGSYHAEVKDSRGCLLNVGPVLLGSVSDISLDVRVTNSGPNENSGTIQITPSGGQGNYTILWENTALTGFNLQNVGPGIYRCQVNDELGCRVLDTIVVDVVNVTHQSTTEGSLAPNPAHDFIELGFPEEIECVYIIASDGRCLMIHSLSIKSRFVNLNIHQLPQGLYQLVATGFNKKFGNRFIKI